MLTFLCSEVFGVIVVEKHLWNSLLGKEGSKSTGAYQGSKIHGSNFSSRIILAYIISIFVPWHQSGKNCFCVPNPVNWRANQVENIQLKHILSFKIMSLSFLVPLFLSSNLHSNSPALITSHCHPKGTQHFGTQTAKLLLPFSKYPKQTLFIYWALFYFLVVTSLAGVQKNLEKSWKQVQKFSSCIGWSLTWSFLWLSQTEGLWGTCEA